MRFYINQRVSTLLVESSIIAQCVSSSHESSFFITMPVNLAQYRGTVGSFNNRNIALKIMYSLRNCRFFRKLNQNMIFLVVSLSCSITLILSLSSALLNNFPTKMKIIDYSVLITFFGSYRHNVYSIYLGTCFTI